MSKYAIVVRSELFPDLDCEVIGPFTTSEEASQFVEDWVDEFFEAEVVNVITKTTFRKSVEDAYYEELEATNGKPITD